MPKAVARLRDIAAQELQGNPHPQVVFMHAAVPSAAEELRVAMTSDVAVEDALVIEAGPVICAHTGAGAVGIAYIA
jgi:fatty acid-binding protein DegV